MIKTIKSQIFLGTFTKDDDFLEFDLVKSSKEIRDLGDIVYFFVAGDEVLKVGKAGGKRGFDGRMSQYKRGPDADTTNKRITRLMEEHTIDKVQIYCVQAPRIITQAKDAFSGLTIDIEAPTNVAMEKYYTNQLIKEHKLVFCYQLSLDKDINKE